MKILLNYLNSLTTAEQAEYAARCNTSVGYLRKAVSVGQRISEALCVALDRESGGAVPFEILRPDVDWDYVRRRAKPKMAALPAKHKRRDVA